MSNPSSSASKISRSIDHPRLKKIDADSIRLFLGQDDKYCKEISERALERNVQRSATFESIRTVQLNFASMRNTLSLLCF